MAEWIQEALEGRSLKATARLYLFGMMILAPIAVLIALEFGDHYLFYATPFLVLILAAIEYSVCYRFYRKGSNKINLGFEPVWLNKGLGQIEDAMTCYERAIEVNLHGADAWLNKCIALHNLGRLAEALDCYDRSLELNQYFGAWYNKGLVLYELNRVEEALTCFDRALQINPHFEPAWFGKGRILEALGRVEAALACYDRALQINPHSEYVWFVKGSLMGNLGYFDVALACFEEAYRLGHKTASQAIAICRQKLGPK